MVGIVLYPNQELGLQFNQQVILLNETTIAMLDWSGFQV